LIEIEGVDVIRMEVPQDDLDSNTTAASDFERVSTAECTTKLQEASRFETALDARPKGIVHREELYSVEPHVSAA